MTSATYIDSLTQKVNAIDLCADLQEVADEVLAELHAQEAALVAELEKFAPLLALLEIPTSIGAVISWIGNFISAKLTMEIQPYYLMLAQQTALITAIANLTSAIEAKAASLGDCTITT